MNSELIEIIDSLQSEPFFYVADGVLKEGLIARYMAQEAAHAEILEFELNVSIRLRRGEGSVPPGFDCHLETSDFQYQISLALADFADEERVELLEHLRPFHLAPGVKGGGSRKKILRKHKGGGLLNISAAAKGLGLSQRALKTLIPCSETRILSEGGARRIEEYYWDKGLIARFEGIWLKHLERRGYNREDLAFIAENCCDGDRRWARDCITGFLRQRTLAESDPDDHA